MDITVHCGLCWEIHIHSEKRLCTACSHITSSAEMSIWLWLSFSAELKAAQSTVERPVLWLVWIGCASSAHFAQPTKRSNFRHYNTIADLAPCLASTVTVCALKTKVSLQSIVETLTTGLIQPLLLMNLGQTQQVMQHAIFQRNEPRLTKTLLKCLSISVEVGFPYLGKLAPCHLVLRGMYHNAASVVHVSFPT